MVHKCNGCKYKGEYHEMEFASMGVCTRTTNLIEAEKNYKDKVCPYELSPVGRDKEWAIQRLIWIRDDSILPINTDNTLAINMAISALRSEIARETN